MKRIIKISAIIAVFLLAATTAAVYFSSEMRAEAAVVRAGSNTADIKLVQSKLKQWGYYTGAVDGIYGSKTVAAVKRFQAANNLTVDGIAGPNTLGKMGLIVGVSTTSSYIRAGSSSADIRKVQQKLKDLGYYKMSVDGIYGSGTVSAVKSFQAANNLSADGVAGPKTLAKLGITAVGGSTTSTSGSSDSYLLAKAIYAEARGEPHIGKVAVGAVILNRVKSADFPNTIAGVIYQPGAFTAVTDGQINLSPDSEAQRAAQDALNGWDPSYGSLFYYNPAKTTSKWIYSRPVVITIGTHVFCK